jgi:hypothetical protein
LRGPSGSSRNRSAISTKLASASIPFKSWFSNRPTATFFKRSKRCASSGETSFRKENQDTSMTTPTRMPATPAAIIQ